MQNWIEMGKTVQMPNYQPMPVVIDRGEGAFLFDVQGKRYIDFVAGVAVSSLGYGDKELGGAIAEQASKLIHASNLVWNEQAIRLEQALCEVSFADKVFLCNSGVEANEAMLKLARKYFYDRQENRFEIICMEKAFHGRTLGTISCTGQAKYQAGFAPLLPGFKAVPLGDLEALRNAITPHTAAVILEPIQGEGGVLVPPSGYLRGVRELCDKTGILMLLDEVQSGVGRTGKLFAYQHEGIEPDAMTLAKGLGGGMPIGALLAKDFCAKALSFPSHGSTFGGNPVCCAAARVVLKKVTRPEFLKQVEENGAFAKEKLLELKLKHPEKIKEIRGLGLWLGVELRGAAGNIRDLALAEGLIINLCGTNVVRFAPPLVIERSVLGEGFQILDRVLEQWKLA